MTNTPELTPLQRWSQLIRVRAEERVSPVVGQTLAQTVTNIVRSRLRTMRKYNEAESINVATVESWFSAETAPQSEVVHEVLLTAIGWGQTSALPTSQAVHSHAELSAKIAAQFAALGSDGGPEQHAAAPLPTFIPPMQQVRELYAQLAATQETILPATMPASLPVKTTKVPQVAAVSGFHDHPTLLNLRNIRNAIDFETILIATCTEKMSESANIHEFLRLYRGHEAQPLEDFARRVGLSPEKISALESGANFPTKAELACYKKVMKDGHAISLESLAISNGLLIHDGLIKERDGTDYQGRIELLDTYEKRIAECLENLPPIYWQAVINKHDNKTDFKQHARQHLWAKKVPDIVFQEDYLRAARGVLSLSREEVAAALKGKVKGVSSAAIEAMETSMANPDSKLGKALAIYYQQKMKDPPFNLGKYDKLGTAYEPEVRPVKAAPVKAAKPAAKQPPEQTTHAAQVTASKYAAKDWPFKG